jgi:hypothetical protein
LTHPKEIILKIGKIGDYEEVARRVAKAKWKMKERTGKKVIYPTEGPFT